MAGRRGRIAGGMPPPKDSSLWLNSGILGSQRPVFFLLPLFLSSGAKVEIGPHFFLLPSEMAVSPFGLWPLTVVGRCRRRCDPYLSLYPPMRGRWSARQTKSISSDLPLVTTRASAGPRLVAGAHISMAARGTSRRWTSRDWIVTTPITIPAAKMAACFFFHGNDGAAGRGQPLARRGRAVGSWSWRWSVSSVPCFGC
jgi:hypothetical protein